LIHIPIRATARAVLDARLPNDLVDDILQKARLHDMRGPAVGDGPRLNNMRRSDRRLASYRDTIVPALVQQLRSESKKTGSKKTESKKTESKKTESKKTESKKTESKKK